MAMEAELNQYLESVGIYDGVFVGVESGYRRNEHTAKFYKKKALELEEKNEANRIDVDNLSKLREAVRKELGCEPDPTQETIIKAIKELKAQKKTLAILLKGSDDIREECIKGYREQVEKLKEEIKKLKEENQ